MVVDYAAAKAGLYGLATTSFPARDTGEKKAKKVGNLGKALCVSQYTVWKKRPEQRPLCFLLRKNLARKIITEGRRFGNLEVCQQGQTKGSYHHYLKGPLKAKV